MSENISNSQPSIRRQAPQFLVGISGTLVVLGVLGFGQVVPNIWWVGANIPAEVHDFGWPFTYRTDENYNGEVATAWHHSSLFANLGVSLILAVGTGIAGHRLAARLSWPPRFRLASLLVFTLLAAIMLGLWTARTNFYDWNVGYVKMQDGILTTPAWQPSYHLENSWWLRATVGVALAATLYVAGAWLMVAIGCLCKRREKMKVLVALLILLCCHAAHGELLTVDLKIIIDKNNKYTYSVTDINSRKIHSDEELGKYIKSLSNPGDGIEMTMHCDDSVSIDQLIQILKLVKANPQGIEISKISLAEKHDFPPLSPPAAEGKRK